MSFAEAIARETGVAVPEKAKAFSVAMSKWIDANRRANPAKGRKGRAQNKRVPKVKGNTAQAKVARKRKLKSAAEGVA